MANEIAANIDHVTLTAGDHSRFCRIRPSAKEGLQVLQSMVVNPIVKSAISIIISAGDAISNRVCGA